MLNFEKKINIALEEYTLLNYLFGVSSAFAYENENILTTFFFIRKELKNEGNGVKGGFLNFRVGITCEFKDQNKKNPLFSANIESHCVFSLECGEGDEGYVVAGTIEDSVGIFYFLFL